MNKRVEHDQNATKQKKEKQFQLKQNMILNNNVNTCIASTMGIAVTLVSLWTDNKVIDSVHSAENEFQSNACDNAED